MAPLPVAKTLMLTTACSAKCSHCPFAHENLPQRHLPVERALALIYGAREELVVVSGGEPFEHPEVAPLLQALKATSKPLRIATGGFVDLTPYLSDLKSLSGLEGLSLGTDVLSSRSKSKDHSRVWKNNVAQLNSAGLGYSLTITIGNDLLDLEDLIAAIKSAGALPQFIYLRIQKDSPSQRWIKIREQFGDTKIIEDWLNPG